MMILWRVILVSIIAFIFFSTYGYAQSKLPSTEVEALRKIADTLGKRNWNFSVDPCTHPSWIENTLGEYENNVTCSCMNNTCHVTHILLKGQNLPGKLPELSGLPSLVEIDLTRNYLSGSIPPQWGSTQLEIISLLGNRISGSIPKEIGNILTLKELILEFNNLSGTIPPELGNLTRVERILVTSNFLNGEIPSTFAKLTTLKDFRISDNNFSGQIPEFIGKWTNLTKLIIQASGLQGPIPTNISNLEKLTDLRFSDLDGSTSNFPTLNTKGIKILILRNCNISGKIPDYLGGFSSLSNLDLSFNRLTGNLPNNIANVKDYLFLTGNLLSGSIPQHKTIDGLDLSYNNITEGRDACKKDNNINLFGSSSMLNNISRSDVAPCLKRDACKELKNYLYINCGGPRISIGDIWYDSDDEPLSPSYFSNRETWVISNTGYFLDGNTKTTYSIGDGSLHSKDPLYSTARISPLSLTYYGHCLMDGEYTVNLHFSEIVFTDNNSYSSLGRRIFDVYIQGERKLKDFNIKLEAGGYGQKLVKNFTVLITNQTLEIRFYWAGKGTIAIPNRGVYGPLISAISVKSNFEVPTKSKTAAIIMGVVIPLTVILLIFGILWWKGCFKKKNTIDPELRGIDLQTGSFTLRQLKAATNDFDSEYKIGEGGFGPVYKGLLSDGTVIAVKQLSSKSKQGNREFINEIGMISALQHPNLVKLYGCCIEESQLLVVYEYMENNSLARALFGPEEQQIKLDWPTRQKICVGIARGLAYLHEESRLKIVHRDIKATNVLLDKSLNPKISDFGLAKLDDEENTHISTRVAGTIGYMAPEYALRGYLTDKADVFSFGIVALEIVCGKSNSNFRPKEDCVYLLDYAYMLKERNSLMELVDSRLGSDFNKEEAFKMINIALLCAQPAPGDRPAMSSVVSMLEGNVPVVEPFSDPNAAREEAKFKAMRNQFMIMQNQDLSHTQTMSDGPWTGSSTSAADLYPINLDSEYLNKRE